MSKKSIRFVERLSENTQQNYRSAINHYETFHGMNIDELVCEALDEQTQQVPPHLLKIIDRLEDFQDYLVSKGFVYSTIMEYMGNIKSIYHKNRIVIPYLNTIDPKRVKRNDVIEFKDILKKEEIIKALKLMRLPQQARVMTMIQGGLSNKECDNLTTRSFIDELKIYHQQDDDVKALNWLADETHPLIWVHRMVREKTGKPFYALIGAEAINTIASAKLYELGLKKYNGELSERLLDQNYNSFWNRCKVINEKLGFGQAGGFNRFRPHMMRKFNATYIRGSALTYEEQSLISNAEIDEMQGRGKTNVQDTYIKTNPIKQKLIYAKVLNNVSLFHQYDFEIVDDDIVLHLVDPNEENRKLKKEVRELSQKLDKISVNRQKLNALRDELGEDVFSELVQGILHPS